MLLLLSQIRMVCDSTYILDQETRYDTKVDETMNIIRNVIESGNEKVVVFSQWERMTRLVASELDKAGIGYSSLSGTVPSEKRNVLISDFWEKPDCRVFVSTDTGSTGLNLQIASLIINLDIPWNPAVLEQRIGRIYRIGQERKIQVVNMISKDSFEERMLSTLEVKSSLFEGLLDGGDDTVILDDNRMNKVLESVAGYVEDLPEAAADADSFDSEIVNDSVSESGYGEEVHGNASVFSNASPVQDSKETCDNAGELVKHGVAFIAGLAETLRSPEKTAKLIDSIVYENPETGNSEIRIPVPGKNVVESVLSVLAKFMGGL